MSAQKGGRRIVNVGNYRFTGKRLGKGNFAIVEEAVHSVLNMKVAIKIMDINELKEDYVIRNLYREAKILSKLAHPSIATLFQTMQYGNMYYLVMELVGGGDLCNFIRTQRNGRLEEHCTRLFARQLVSAISHMHNLGIVHRDLKMENVMLSSNNDRIKIVDFGLSNVYTGDSLMHTHCGSPEYAAPELFVEGKPYGPEVDLWSLGVILYGMAVGQLPFVSGSRNVQPTTQRRDKLIEQINRGLSAPHRKALALFSVDFKTMMDKLLVADSSKRINIGELCFHPWITDKGRKAIRSNPLKRLEDRSRFDIIRDVADRSDTPWQDVQRALHIEPQGNLSGMFNLLAHKAMNHTLDAELLMAKMHLPSTSRTAANRVVAEGGGGAKFAKLKSQAVKRQDTARSTPAKKPEGGKCGDTPRKIVAAKRPIAVKPEGSQLLDNHTNHTRSPGGDASRDNPQCMFNAFPFNSGPAQNTRSKKTKIDSIMPQANQRHTLRSVHRTLSATTKPSDNRQVTTCPPGTICERPVKRRSMLPVLQMNKTAPSATNGLLKCALLPKNRLYQITKSAPLERSDDFKRCNGGTGGINRKVDLSNEPIARSIAGYMTRNINKTKVESLKWVKGATSNYGT